MFNISPKQRRKTSSSAGSGCPSTGSFLCLQLPSKTWKGCWLPDFCVLPASCRYQHWSQRWGFKEQPPPTARRVTAGFPRHDPWILLLQAKKMMSCSRKCPCSPWQSPVVCPMLCLPVSWKYLLGGEAVLCAGLGQPVALCEV